MFEAVEEAFGQVSDRRLRPHPCELLRAAKESAGDNLDPSIENFYRSVREQRCLDISAQLKALDPAATRSTRIRMRASLALKMREHLQALRSQHIEPILDSV